MAAQPPFAVQPSQNTQLPTLQEMQFLNWLKQNNVPFNPNAQQSDYDMRGFYRGMQQGNPMATTGINPNDNLMHYTDYWKTPSHQSFSAGSQWATPSTPDWINDSQLAAPSGKIMFDEKLANAPTTTDNLMDKAMMGLMQSPTGQ
jgi:hypothetical protein